VREALSSSTDALMAAGVETPRLDAELLLAEATGWDRAHLAAAPEAGIGPAAGRRFGEMVRRRIRREPVAYILGRKGFRNIELGVDRRVLIPRPETELLVEVAVELQPRTVLDVGTGSGAIALAIADELADVAVRATDTSADALELARANADRLGLAERVKFERVSSSSRYPRISRQSKGFHLVVANLPYVAEAELSTVPPEIRDWEPREAVIAGAEGLEAIRDLLAAPPHCRAIALEVGVGQAPEVESLVREVGFRATERRRDLAGIERVVVGRRQ
jgi:release factor glutamine methyltransferase